MARVKDYYHVLGIPPRSHARVIEETYWEQAHELHRQPTKRAAKRLSQINEAYEVLGSPHRRAVYDERFLSRNGLNGYDEGGLLRTLVNLIGKPFRVD